MKTEPVYNDKPKCPFCGRRKTLKQIEDDYYCTHCEQMFSGKLARESD